MQFFITNQRIYNSDPNIVYLLNNNWDDWFEFETVYNVYYLNRAIGCIKIGRRGQTERRAPLPPLFDKLPDDYFSLGTSADYYVSLNSCNERIDILNALNDLAYNLDLFEEVRTQRVTQISLLRDISISTVRGQFHRIADGGAVLTDYDFKYILPDKDFVTGEYQQRNFQVDANNNTPPSNIHVLIGNNGIGKTTIIKGMLRALLFEDTNDTFGKIETGWGETFSNIVNISFSAFDDPICPEDVDNNKIPYTYMGLIHARYENGIRKRYAAYDQLPILFFECYYQIIKSATKRELWERSIKILASDSTFDDLNIQEWSKKDQTEFLFFKNNYHANVEESDTQYKNRLEKEFYWNRIYNYFSPLSSGHKNILLTLVSLITQLSHQ